MEADRQIANFKQLFMPIVLVLNWLWSVVLSLVIIGGIVGILYFTGARETWLWLNAMTWEQTQCEIDRVYNGRQERTEGAGSTSVKISFKVSASYRYRNDFGAYVGRRYDFKRFRGSFQSVKKDLNYLRSNATVPCYYNPRKPEQSVINRGFQTSFFFILIPILSLGIFAYMMFLNLLQKLDVRKLFQRKQLRQMQS